MGKTAFTLNIATNAAIRREKTVAFFSLEMSKEQLALRMFSAEGQVDSQRLRVGDLKDEEWQKLIRPGAAGGVWSLRQSTPSGGPGVPWPAPACG